MDFKNLDFKTGDLVTFTGASDAQVQWGGHSDPRPLLQKGKLYVVADVEVHSTYTRISLKGIKGQFNSVSFEPA